MDRFEARWEPGQGQGFRLKVVDLDQGNGPGFHLALEFCGLILSGRTNGMFCTLLLSRNGARPVA